MVRSIEKKVRQRAHDICEYCQMPQEYDDLPHQIDHITAQQDGGETTVDNLALSCLHCNKHKGPNIASIDPSTGTLSALFHPRRDKWDDHFEWNGARLVGRTATGRATIRVLAINHPDYVALRRGLIDEGVFPPIMGETSQRPQKRRRRGK
jgi:hypothetical protein